MSLVHHRVVEKNGNCNVHQQERLRPKLSCLKYFTLVDSSWPYTVFVFLVTLLVSWMAFAIAYWIICTAHGDFDFEHLPEMQEAMNFTPCIYNMNNFYSCFLFSIEAQHTVGYGIKATTEECAEAIFVNIIQCILGFVMQGFMAVIIFSKMTIPKLRSQTILFSKNAVLAQKDQKSYFMFRIGDIRKDYLSETKCRAIYVFTEKTDEGEILKNQQIDLKLETDGCETTLFFNWPVTMAHLIDEKSPLKDIKNNRQNFEIVVLLEGNIDSTGQTSQGRTSYIYEEILWDKKFENIFSFDQLANEFEVDFAKFHHTI